MFQTEEKERSSQDIGEKKNVSVKLMGPVLSINRVSWCEVSNHIETTTTTTTTPDKKTFDLTEKIAHSFTDMTISVHRSS